VVVSAVAGGAPARATLVNSEGDPALRLRARSNGSWGNELGADARAIINADSVVVRVTLRILRGGQEVERFDDLVVDPGSPLDLFAIVNRLSKYVVAIDPGFEGDDPQAGSYPLDEDGRAAVPQVDAAATTLMVVEALPGVAPEGVTVVIQGSDDDIRFEVLRNGTRQELFEGLTMDPDSDRHLAAVIAANSQVVQVQAQSSLPEDQRLPAATATPVAFTSGSSPNVDAYRTAIDRLADDTRIDLVLAAIEPGRDAAEVSQIHQALVGHSVAMADNAAPRIAFGSVPRSLATNRDAIRDHAAAVRNRRMVLVSPPGAAGAVAGLVGRMTPMDSPTFKPVPLHGIAPASYRESELNQLLGPTTNLCVVQNRAGRGVVVLKGIDTTGDQISVTRVADQAIRETKAIAENFIGRLNSDDARTALQQQLVATFTRMERAGALVPSTDGTDPAFVVDVYSTQQDFAQGIVRIDIAVRPVRAIDYVYATIRVKN
jgi:hypothetical protein